VWRIRLAAAAEKDFVAIIQWTAEYVGARQAGIYRGTLYAAFGALGEGPEIPGSMPRDDILPGPRTLHIARGGRRGRHFVMYRSTGSDTIEIVRILHDAVDLAGHIAPEYRSERVSTCQRLRHLELFTRRLTSAR
jgi:toxin ParE1/3/4